VLEAPPPIRADDLARHLRTAALGRRLHLHEALASTNDEAQRLAREGAAHGTAVIAEAQERGRGRLGRAWASPARKNLYLSVVLRPLLPPARVAELPLVAAVAVAEALGDLGIAAGIKWPNDLLVDDRKIAGILGEAAFAADAVRFAVLGIGVNLNATVADLPEEVRPLATTARELLGRPVDRAAFAASLLGHLEAWYGRLVAEGFAPVAARWRKGSATLGRRVRVAELERTFEGEAVDIDDTGALLVRTGAGIERILSGDVTRVRPVESR
jgi:BirA family biotin operon repressor/biotin-[acetyl-CoA-carboxylase] ligase